ncbi:hypothetical protein BH24ACI4_BH24ACI4_19890 [soil metagenome]
MKSLVSGPFRISVCALVLACCVVSPGVLAQEMPDLSQMSGVPLPVGDVQPGTVTVRVIRGSFANPVVSQTVEMTGGAASLRATTNEAGRAEFTGLAAGLRLKATATVGGERLESQEFTVPPTGGIRLMLVAGEPGTSSGTNGGAGTAAATAAPGGVVLGDESRFVFEMGEDGLSVFYVLQILNRSSSPVQPEAPIVFSLPAEARSARVLEGSSPQATVGAGRLEIAGPFSPGATIVQLGYTLPLSGSNLVVEQPLPLPLAHMAVVAQKVGDLELSSPQMTEQRTMPAQGNLYIAGRGSAVAAGEVLRFQFSKVPHHPTWPRNLAIGLALLILVGGAWSSVGSATARAARVGERRQLEVRRDTLFEELTALELRNRDGAVDPALYAERRRELVSALEGIYMALDDDPAVERTT